MYEASCILAANKRKESSPRGLFFLLALAQGTMIGASSLRGRQNERRLVRCKTIASIHSNAIRNKKHKNTRAGSFALRAHAAVVTSLA